MSCIFDGSNHPFCIHIDPLGCYLCCTALHLCVLRFEVVQIEVWGIWTSKHVKSQKNGSYRRQEPRTKAVHGRETKSTIETRTSHRGLRP